MLGTIGALIAPVFAPLGFGFWQAAVALLTGFIAKEMVVSSLSMFYGFSLTAAGGAVAAAMTGFTPLSAFSMLVFILLYVPCVAATSTMAKELGSAKWTAFSVVLADRRGLCGRPAGPHQWDWPWDLCDFVKTS